MTRRIVGYKRRFPQGGPEDHLGNRIEVGDQYFYGSPPTVGIVVKVYPTTIAILEIHALPDDELRKFMSQLALNNFDILYERYFPVSTRHYPTEGIMKCKSPRKGICLNKNILL